MLPPRFAETPRRSRVTAKPRGGSPKGTIGDFFASRICLLCSTAAVPRASARRVCDSCLVPSGGGTQAARLRLLLRAKGMERSWARLAAVCSSCSGGAVPREECGSMDCPLLPRARHAAAQLEAEAPELMEEAARL